MQPCRPRWNSGPLLAALQPCCCLLLRAWPISGTPAPSAPWTNSGHGLCNSFSPSARSMSSPSASGASTPSTVCVAYWPSMSAECRSVSLVLVCGLLVETKVTPALAPGGHVLHTNPASGSNVVHTWPSSASYVPRLQAAASRQCLPWRSPRQPSRTRRPCSPRLASPRLRSPAARRAGSSGRTPSPATPSARRRR